MLLIVTTHGIASCNLISYDSDRLAPNRIGLRSKSPLISKLRHSLILILAPADMSLLQIYLLLLLHVLLTYNQAPTASSGFKLGVLLDVAGEACIL